MACSIDNMDNVEHKIVCPYCDYEKPMSLDRLPSKPVAATCPKCSSRFMFKPAAAQSDNNGNDEKPGVKKIKHKTDYDLIGDEFFSFYIDLFHKHKDNLKIVSLLFFGYGMMYFVATSAYYLNKLPQQRPVGTFYDYLPGIFCYIMFFPVTIMHSWKFIGASGGRILDQLFRYSSTFIIVTLSYIACLHITSYFFNGNQLPLALMLPVILSLLVPSLLHVTMDSL